MDDTTVDFVSHPIDTTGYAMADVLFGINDAANTTVLIYNEAGEVVEKTGNYLEYGDYEAAGDLKMTDEQYKEWQAYKQKEIALGIDVGYSVNGIILSERDIKVCAIINDLDRIQEFDDSDKVDILVNMSKDPISPTHGDDAQIWITCPYPLYSTGLPHTGVDLGNVVNSEVYSISGGEVKIYYSGEFNGININNVKITDIDINSEGNEEITTVIYKHTTYSSGIANDEQIDSGQIIGKLDKSGEAAGHWHGGHLHFQVQGGDNNPYFYIFKNQPNLKWNFDKSPRAEKIIKTNHPALYDAIIKYGSAKPLAILDYTVP